MSLQYTLVKVAPSPDTVSRVIRDDVNGAVIEVSSAGIAARIMVRDLISEINRLEELKQKTAETPLPLEDGVNE